MQLLPVSVLLGWAIDDDDVFPHTPSILMSPTVSTNDILSLWLSTPLDMQNAPVFGDTICEEDDKETDELGLFKIENVALSVPSLSNDVSLLRCSS